ncbi:hypothetical protein KP509_39G041500 [Ceratopteris richardii]|nr:hypothetical protein KP509_39G041500 [Ceratopteris richardii]
MHQLEDVMEQKQVSDERISQMDGALRESMRKLRQLHEEQEQTIHEAVTKKTRELENLKLELQQRLADADHQLVEAEFQNSLLSKRVQEQDGMIAQLTQAHSKAEGKIDTLQVRVEIFERENASLKYEVTVLNKELIIRNQERDMNKKSLDAASRQKAESTKKISKLERECQRLRALVRKKLPGPGALVQMQMEVEGWDNGRMDFNNKWRLDNKTFYPPNSTEYFKSSDGSFSNCLLTIEEETKFLKGILAERNNELQTVKTMCVQLAEKLSNMESQQTGLVQNSPRRYLLGNKFHHVDSYASLSSLKEPSHASMSEDGVDDDCSVTDSWGSALISELPCFQEQKDTRTQQLQKSPSLHKDQEQFDSTDDFLEIERIVSLSSVEAAKVEDEMQKLATIKDALTIKEAELKTANMKCTELKDELASAEQQLSALSLKNASNELSLYNLQQKLNILMEKVEEGKEAETIENIKGALADLQFSTLDGLQANVTKLSKASTSNISSEAPLSPPERTSHCQTFSHSAHEKMPNTETELERAVEEMVHVIEELFLGSKAEQQKSTCDDCVSHSSENSCAHSLGTENSVYSGSTFNNFKTTASQFVQGKLELPQFIKELSSAIFEFAGQNRPLLLISQEQPKHDAFKSGEPEVISDVGGPSSSNCNGSEHPSIKDSPRDESLSSLSQFQLDCELRRLRAEKAAMESHMQAEFRRMDKVEELLVEVQHEKSDLVKALEEEKEKHKSTKNQLLDSKQLIATLHDQLASTEVSKNTANEQLTLATKENSKLASQLQECKGEITNMQEMLRISERSLEEEQTRSENLQATVERLKNLLERDSEDQSDKNVVSNAEENIKKDGITNATQKLAECQQMILILNQQLQSIASANISLPESFNPSSLHTEQLNPSLPSEADICTPGSSVFISKRGQRTCSDPVDFSMSDITNKKLALSAKVSEKSDTQTMNSEDCIQVVPQQLPGSTETDLNRQIIPYASPKRSVKKKNAWTLVTGGDVTKSLDVGSVESSRRRNTFSKIFSRNKKTIA